MNEDPQLTYNPDEGESYDEGDIEAFLPRLADLEALKVLIDSKWFAEECENANHHSLYGRHGWLSECLTFGRRLREEHVKKP